MDPVQLGSAQATAKGGIRPHAGGSLDPRQVVGRDRLVEEMFDRLAQGIPLLITDPRRMGKTCVLDRLVLLADAPWTAVKIDYEGVTTGADFLGRTAEGLRAHQAIHTRVVEVFKAFVDNIEVTAGPITVNPAFRTRSASELLETVLSRIDDRLEGDELLVLALDEVPIAIENIARNEGPLAADALLQSLRRLRQRQGSRVRWILTGSIGFHHVLRFAETTEGAINDLENVPCGPLESEAAAELGIRLLMGIEAEFDERTVESLIEVSGGIPYLMHFLAHTMRGNSAPCTPYMVREAWEAFVQDRDSSRAVTHLLTRIERYYGERDGLACRLLDLVALATEPVSFDAVDAVLAADEGDDAQDVTRRLLDDLTDDHYLRSTRAGVTWRYPVLRDIWIVRRKLSNR